MEIYILAGVLASLSVLDHTVLSIILGLSVVSIIIGYVGKRKKIGFLNAFLFSFFCTPVTAIIVVILSKKLCICQHCGLEITDYFEFCPECGKNTEVVILSSSDRA
jgi:hypothetical protein